MKMDAAEPFNVPVNPVELGIPVSMNCSLHTKLVFLGVATGIMILAFRAKQFESTTFAFACLF